MILVSDDYWPDADSAAGWRGTLKRVLLRRLAAKVASVSRRSQARAVLTSHTLASRLPHGLEIPVTAWAEEHTHAVNHAELSGLHAFADAVYAVAQSAPPGLGLVHRSVTLSYVSEMRWLDPLLTQRLFYAAIVAERFERDQSLCLGILNGDSIPERLAVEVAIGRGASVRRFPSAEFRLAGRLSQRQFASHPHEFRKMTGRDLAHVAAAEREPIPAKSLPRVMFIGRVDRTVERLIAAMPAFARRSQLEVVLLHSWRVKTVERVRQAGATTSDLYGWISPAEAQALVDRVRSEAIAGWDHVRSQATGALGAKFHGVGIFGAAEDLLRAVHIDGSSRAALFIELAERAVAAIQPDLVVSFEDAEVNRALSVVCEHRGIPTLAYYAISPVNVPGLVRRSQRWLAVSGRHLERSFRSGRHRWDERVRVVGDTLVDRVANESRERARTMVCQRLGLDEARPILVLLSTWAAFPMNLHDIQVVFQRTAEAARAIPGVQLVVKTHPLQPTSDVERWMRDWHCEGTVVGDVDLFALSLAADIVSTTTTSAVWQSLTAGTPVICLQPRGNVERFESVGFEFLAGRGVVYIPQEDDAGSVVRALLFNRDMRDAQITRGRLHAADHAGPSDGRSGDRLATFIHDILRDGAPE